MVIHVLVEDFGGVVRQGGCPWRSHLYPPLAKSRIYLIERVPQLKRFNRVGTALQGLFIFLIFNVRIIG